MRQIPTEFQLYGRTYKVRAMTEAEDDQYNAYGIHEFEDALIAIDMTQKSSLRMETFWHELAHALLDATGRFKLSEDEKFVGQLGNLLHQFHKTKKGAL